MRRKNIMLRIYLVQKYLQNQFAYLIYDLTWKTNLRRKFIFCLKVYPFYFECKFRFIKFQGNMKYLKIYFLIFVVSFYLIWLFISCDDGNSINTVTCNRNYSYMRNTCPQIRNYVCFSFPLLDFQSSIFTVLNFIILKWFFGLYSNIEISVYDRGRESEFQGINCHHF